MSVHVLQLMENLLLENLTYTQSRADWKLHNRLVLGSARLNGIRSPAASSCVLLIEPHIVLFRSTILVAIWHRPNPHVSVFQGLAAVETYP